MAALCVPDITSGISIYEACFLHDLKYWCGHPGEDVDRLKADAELMIDVSRIRDSVKMAEIMFHGVRRGGTEHLKHAFSWGFGSPTPLYFTTPLSLLM